MYQPNIACFEVSRMNDGSKNKKRPITCLTDPISFDIGSTRSGSPEEGKIVDVNQSMLDLFGYSREEMVGLHARETYVHPEDQLKFKKEIQQQGFVKDFETKLRKKDGTEMECLLTSIVSWTADGNIAGYQGIIRDITERKQAEETREKLIHQLQDALTNIKTLRGLLPFALPVMRIRDDKGYWYQIESYIAKHSEAEFSHGICPECMKKYYPDFVDNEE